MTKFKRKNFGIASGLKKTKRKVLDFYHKNPASVVTTGTFIASTSNLAMNASRKNQDKKYQDDQLNAMRDLTKALGKVDETLVKSSDNSSKKGNKGQFFKTGKIFSKSENNMIKFRRKDFSILGNTIQGASIGASLGVMATGFGGKNARGLNLSTPNFKQKVINSAINSFNSSSPFVKRMEVVGAFTLVGAALGALVGSIKEGNKIISRKSTVDNRLMSKVIDDLNRTGFKEGEDYTRDPRTADKLKSVVSIAITKNSGELRLLVNTISDKKLKELTSELVKNLPNTSVVSEEARNKYNELSISSISDGSADVGLITGIAEKFIRNGYPVYLVEVG